MCIRDRKVTGLADLQGLTIRVQESDMMSEMITDLGAQPVKVVYSKVYAALHHGEIDGAENNWPSYEARGHYEVCLLYTAVRRWCCICHWWRMRRSLRNDSSIDRG